MQYVSPVVDYSNFFCTKPVMEKDIVTRLREFMDNEAKSCSMDFGCVTPKYVHRMWGGMVPFDKIEKAWLMVKGSAK